MDRSAEDRMPPGGRGAAPPGGPGHGRPPDHEARRRILEDLDTTMLVEAAAGTGKTTSLIGRMAALIRTGRCTIDRIAAITFTRKAAAELRARLQTELERAARAAEGEERDRLREAIGRIERGFVGTIHSFCARLLRERPIEAGVAIGFGEIEEDEDRRIRERAWEEFTTGLFAAGDDRLDRLLELGLDLADLEDAYETIARFPDVEEWPAADVEIGELAPVRAALREYVEDMRVLARTFPEDRGTDGLMDRYERIVRIARARDLSRTAELMRLLEEFDGPSGATQKCWPEGAAQGKAEKTRWESFRDETVAEVLDRWRARRYALVVPLLRDAVALYDRRRGAGGRLNFQDLLMRSVDLLRGRPAVRRYFRKRFTHVLVDEFQDTDPIQGEIMMLLTSGDPEERDWRRCVPGPGSLFVVGDPKQSIYRFRRADIVTYNRVRERIEASGGATVMLTASFRSTVDLVEWNNRVFDDFFPAEASEEAPAACPMAVGEPGFSPGALGGVRTSYIPGDLAKNDSAMAHESRLIARWIRQALDTGLTVPRTIREREAGVGPGLRPEDILIVTRNKKPLAIYARELQKLGIPHQVSGGSALGQVEELAMLAGCLRAVVEPENPVALVALLRGALFGLPDTALYAWKRAGGRFHWRFEPPEGLPPETGRPFREIFNRLRRYHRLLRRMPPVPAIEAIAADLGLTMSALSRPGGNVLAGSFSKMLEMLRGRGADLVAVSEIVEEMSRLIEEEVEFDGVPARPPERPGVRLMNLHKAKGLEAPVVFLASPTGWRKPSPGLHVDRTGGSTRGYLEIRKESPSGYGAGTLLARPLDWMEWAERETAFEEAERNRLLYVASTRAGRMLVISYWGNGRGQGRNAWKPFGKYLDGCVSLEEPGEVAAPAGRLVRVTDADAAEGAREIAARRTAVSRPTFRRAAAKEIAVPPGGAVSRPDAGRPGDGSGAGGAVRSMPDPHQPAVPAAGEHGVEWGTVVHTLLEVAMRGAGRPSGTSRGRGAAGAAEPDPAEDPGKAGPRDSLESLARAQVAEQGLPPSSVGAALETVAAVRRSEIWRRAAAAERVLVEAPFVICRAGDEGAEGGKAGCPAGGGDRLGAAARSASAGSSPAGGVGMVEEPGVADEKLPVVIRGAVDLAFREADGWVIVDYKTDRVDGGRDGPAPGAIDALAAHYGGQVRLYADVWREITGEPVKEAGLFFVRTGAFVTVG